MLDMSDKWVTHALARSGKHRKTNMSDNVLITYIAIFNLCISVADPRGGGGFPYDLVIY